MEDLDGIDTDEEYATDTDEDEEQEVEDDDEDDDDDCYEHQLVDDDAELPEEGGVAGESDRVDNAVSEVDSRRRLLSDPRSSSSSSSTADETSLRPQSAKTFGGSLGGGSRRKQAPWAAAGEGAGATTRSAAGPGVHSSGGGGSLGPGGQARSMGISVRRKKSLSSSPSSENLGNLGVFKVLGEAFMRRFNTYSDQVRAGECFLWYAVTRDWGCRRWVFFFFFLLEYCFEVRYTRGFHHHHLTRVIFHCQADGWQ